MVRPKTLMVFILGIALGATAPGVDAQELDAEMTRCAAMTADLDRLACFDGVARSFDLAPEKKRVPITGSGKWKIEEESNPLDDSKTVTLILAADDGTSRWGDPVHLVLRCASRKTNAFLSWGTYLGNETNLTTRMGLERAISADWSLSTNSQSSFYPTGTSGPHGVSPRYFIMALSAVDTFVAQTTPYNENPITAVFDVRGVENAAQPLMEECGWNPEEYRPDEPKDPSTATKSILTPQMKVISAVANDWRVLGCFDAAAEQYQFALAPLPFRIDFDEERSAFEVVLLDAAYRDTFLGDCLVGEIQKVLLDSDERTAGEINLELTPPSAD